MSNMEQIKQPLPKGTEYFLKYIKSRISKNKNFLCCIVGQTGSGKSYSGLSLMEELNGKQVNTDNVCLRAKDFIKRIKDGLADGTLKKGDVILWDEAGIDLNSKQWQSIANRVVNFIMQVFRKENLVVIFTLPYFSFLDSDARKLVHCLITTKRIDFKTKTCKVKPYLIQTNQVSGKMYRHRLRVNIANKGYTIIDGISIPMPSKEFVDIYESKKNAFTKSVYEEAYNTIEKAEAKQNKPTREQALREKDERRIARAIIKLSAEGMPQSQMEEIFGVTQSNISLILRNAQNNIQKVEIA